MKIGLVIGILGALIGIGAAFYATPTLGGVFAVTVGIIVVTLLIVFVVLWKVLGPMFQSKKLLKTGEPGQARVLNVQDTGVTVNMNPQIKLLLEVTPQDRFRQPYQVETKLIISRLQTSFYQPGMMLSVRIDPKDPSKVAVESVGAGMGSSGTNWSAGQAQKELQEIDKRNREIISFGEAAKAIVTKYTEMGINVNGNNPAVTLGLKVMPRSGAPFDAEAKGVIAHQSIPRFQAGREIHVRFDPRDHSMVAIESS